MESAIATLMVLGIFVGIPAVIGFAAAGVYIWSNRRVRTAKRTKAVEEAISEALAKQAAEAQGEAVSREPVKEPVQVVEY